MKYFRMILIGLLLLMTESTLSAQEGKSPSKRLVFAPSFSTYAKAYVEKEINEWQKKGEFEKTSDWRVRVNEATRNAKIDELTRKAQRDYISEFTSVGQSSIEKSKFTLKEYDADNEIFLIKHQFYGNMLIPVPIDDAQQFKKSWNSITITSPTYFIENDQIALAALSFKIPGGKIYTYSNKASLSYTLAKIDYNFLPIEIDIDESKSKGNQTIMTKNLSIGKSDVDINIPETDIKNDKTFAVIVANEDYMQLSKVPYAINDSKVFSEYCYKTLGIPKSNIKYYENATYGMMKNAIFDIKNIAKAYNGNINVLFYYAGHGAPDENDKNAYLIPTDAYKVANEVCYALNDFYSDLYLLNAKSVTVFMDACFTGATRNGKMLTSARGIAIIPKQSVPQGNIVVFSAASKDETALPYTEKGHGLFTYFLLKKIQDTKGNVTYGELADYLIEKVSRHSAVINEKNQTPSIIPGISLINSWKTMSLR